MTRDDIINAEIEQEHKETRVRRINILTLSNCEVFATDTLGNGGANHEYEIRPIPPAGATISENDILTKIKFQNGVIPENGINGCTMEDLIAICIDRLDHFQMGNYPCRENAIAKTKLEEALLWLNKRTTERQSRGVEGTNII